MRIAAEPLNDVAFPVGGAIAGIHRIEGGFLVHVLGMPRAKPQEILCRRVERHALRREFTLNPLAEQGQDLVGRIVADGQGAIHHQSGLGEYFALRIGFENAPHAYPAVSAATMNTAPSARLIRVNKLMLQQPRTSLEIPRARAVKRALSRVAGRHSCEYSR